MPAFPFEWWLVFLVCTVGSIVWLIAIYMTAGKGAEAPKAKSS